MHTPEPSPFTRGVTSAALSRLLHADLSSLAGLEVGVATSSFQTEGGLDGPGEPETNWRRWAELGRVERIGAACDLWRRFDQIAARGRAMGLDVFRPGLEWARICPHGEALDARAVEGYARRLETLRAAGLEPVVTLQHFTHPAWLGPDFWLDEKAPALFARYATAATTALGEALARRGQRPLARVLTINEPNMLAASTYLVGTFPHGRGAVADGDPLGLPRAVRMLDHLMAGHVRAYRAIHAAYAARGWPAPDVTWNLSFVDFYGVCRLLFDLLRAPERGVRRRDLAGFVRRGRDAFAEGFYGDERSPRVETARALQRVFEQVVAPELFGAALDALYEAPAARALDSLAIDVYDPWSHHQVHGADALFSALARGASLALLRDAVAGGLQIAEPWEWRYEPEALVRALRAVHDPVAPLPIDVMENGMAERRPAGAPRGERDDGITRPEFIRGYTFALAYARAVERLPVRTYCYWTLVDNYELGRYAPRFGLYALSDPCGGRRAGPWAETDAGGRDAAATLADFARVVSRARAEPAEARALLAALYHPPVPERVDEGANAPVALAS